MLGSDQALDAEKADRLSDSDAGDTEELDQLGLGGQLSTRSVLTGFDLPPKHCGHLPIDRKTARPVDHRRCLHWSCRPDVPGHMPHRKDA
jgi:hypothetical protein